MDSLKVSEELSNKSILPLGSVKLKPIKKSLEFHSIISLNTKARKND